MDASFIPVEVVPSKTPFGLDQLRRSYKTALSATAAIAAAPVVGTADETFPNMFLMPVSTPESAESATRIDLVYLGCFGGAEGSPVLPPGKRQSGDAVQSASSQQGPIGGFAISAPVTFQFYAPTNVLTWISTSIGSLGPSGDVLTPSGEITIISATFSAGSLPFGFTGNWYDFFRYNFFIEIITTTLESEEIVPNQYWQNVKRKTKILTAYTYVTGANISLNAPGTGYALGNSIGISGGGGAAAMTVTAINGTGGILSWNVTSNTCTTAATGLAASGGSGSGATFDVVVIA